MALKIYYTLKFERVDRSSSSILARILNSNFGGSVIFPIAKRAIKLEEKSLKKRANTAVYLFYFFFFLGMLFLLL